MARKAITIAAIVTMAILAVAASLPAALADAKFIASTCKSSDNPACQAVLSTDPGSAKATTVHELANIGLDIATANAKDSHAFLSGEAKKRGRTDVGDALGDCVQHYGEAMDQLEAARVDFDAGRYGDAERATGAAEDTGDRCEQAFSDRKLASTVSDVDRRMKDRSSVASDLIDLLWIVKRSGRRPLLRV